MLTPFAVFLAASLGPDPAVAIPRPSADPAPATFTLERMVPKGEARMIAFYTSLFPDCSSQGPVVIRVLRPPQHGKVTLETTQSFPQYVSSSPLVECNGRKVPGKKMVYEGEEGYEGWDSFRILVINADGSGYESEVKVSVR